MEKKLKECQKQRDEYLAGWQRSRADFLNYKKEEAKRVTEILKYATEDLLLKVLPVLDNFEKAEKEIPKDRKTEYLEGLLQIKSQLKDFLKNQGIEEIKAVGEKLDPNFHEVAESVEGEESGIIIEEVQKGYKLNGKVVRPAKVKVNK
jgi:molecular chaperone GrpE